MASARTAIEGGKRARARSIAEGVVESYVKVLRSGVKKVFKGIPVLQQTERWTNDNGKQTRCRFKSC